MATFIPLNDGTHPCLVINGVKQATPVNGEIAAADVVYCIPSQTNVNGTLTATVTAYVGQNGTTPIPYVFNVSSLANFLTFLSGLSITNTLVTYTNLKKIEGTINRAFVLPSVLINSVLIQERVYNSKTNITTITISALTQPYFGNVVLGVLGNQSTGGTAATASLAVPIAASPTAGNTLTGYINQGKPNQVLLGVVTVGAGETQAQVKTAVDLLYNSNGLGFTFVGTLSTNVDTLAGTAPTTGSFYDGYTVSFVPTGATFGSSTVSATFTSGV